ncbi:hypothetical protein Tco_0061988, partial [Tanacetum coccineum]
AAIFPNCKHEQQENPCVEVFLEEHYSLSIAPLQQPSLTQELETLDVETPVLISVKISSMTVSATTSSA